MRDGRDSQADQTMTQVRLGNDPCLGRGRPLGWPENDGGWWCWGLRGAGVNPLFALELNGQPLMTIQRRLTESSRAGTINPNRFHCC